MYEFGKINNRIIEKHLWKIIMYNVDEKDRKYFKRINKSFYDLNRSLCHKNKKLLEMCQDGDIESIIELSKNDNFSWNEGLYNACESGNKFIVDYMIYHNSKKWGVGSDEKWSKAFFFACRYNHMDVVKKFVEKDYHDIANGIIGACTGNNVQILEYLLSFDFDLHYLFEGITTGIEFINIDVVMCIINHYSGKKFKFTTLPCKNECVDILKYLMNRTCGWYDNTFMNACTESQIDCVKLLLPVIDNSSDHYKDCMAKSSKNFEIFKLLYDNSIGYLNNNTIFAICDRNYISIMKESIVNNRIKDMKKCFELACMSKNISLTMIKLVAPKRITNMTNIIYHLCKAGNSEIVKFCVSRCFDDKMDDNDIEFFKLRNGYFSFSRWVSDMNKDKNGGWSYGMYIALLYNNLEVSKIMQECGAKNYSLIFVGACEIGNKQIMQEMISKGVTKIAYKTALAKMCYNEENGIKYSPDVWNIILSKVNFCDNCEKYHTNPNRCCFM